MGEERFYARVAADPALVARVARELAAWDPRGEFRAPDDETSPASHANAILGILSAGGHTAAVKGYLRRAESSALGEPRTTSEERGQFAERIWRIMVDAAVQAAADSGTRA